MHHLIGGETLPDEPGLGTFETLAQYGGIHKIHASIMEMISNRRVVLTDCGYFGIVPGLAKVGDLCGVIFGTKTQFLLKGTADVGHYRLVGEAFITSARSLDNGRQYSYYMGAGKNANEDWLECDLEEQDIILC